MCFSLQAIDVNGCDVEKPRGVARVSTDTVEPVFRGHPRKMAE